MTLRARLFALLPYTYSVGTMAVVSASNFVAGLILIRYASNEQYGFYVLSTTTILLLLALQGGFFQPQAVRVARLESAERGVLLHGLMGIHGRLIGFLYLAALAILGLVVVSGRIEPQVAALVGVVELACVGAMYREVRRMMLLACRRVVDVFRADFVYGLLLIVGVALAARAPSPALLAVLSVLLAALAGGTLIARALWKSVGDARHDRHTMLFREMAPVGIWGVTGALVQWVFTQGYTYVVAAKLGAAAVAAIAATRLLLMPINLLSSGLSQTLLPTTAKWLNTQSLRAVFVRLCWVALGVLALAGCYALVVWMLRDFIFDKLMHKRFAERDALLALWMAVFGATVLREQLGYLLAARLKYRQLSSITFVSATVAILVTLICLDAFGDRGALMGLLTGEVLNLVGILGLTLLELSRAGGGNTEHRP